MMKRTSNILTFAFVAGAVAVLPCEPAVKMPGVGDAPTVGNLAPQLGGKPSAAPLNRDAAASSLGTIQRVPNGGAIGPTLGVGAAGAALPGAVGNALTEDVVKPSVSPTAPALPNVTPGMDAPIEKPK